MEEVGTKRVRSDDNVSEAQISNHDDDLMPVNKLVKLRSGSTGTDEELHGIDEDDENIQQMNISLPDLVSELKQAIKESDEQLVNDTLLQVERFKDWKYYLDMKDEHGYNILMFATRHSSVNVCSALLDRGIDINAITEKGNSSLLYASQRGLVEVVDRLVDSNVSMICANTALIPASHFGRQHVVQILLGYGANVNFTNAKGTTALMRAAQEGHSDVVKQLLSAEACPNVSNFEGMTALMLASQRGHAGIVKILITSGADINMTTRQGSTALLLSAKRNHEDTVVALVTAGADIYKKDDRQKTPVSIAKRRGHHHLLKYLNMEAQLRLMQQASRAERSYSLMTLASLVLQGRADIIPVNAKSNNVEESLVSLAAVREEFISGMTIAMSVPSPILRIISSMIPVAPLYDVKLRVLRARSISDPHSVVVDCMKVFDQVLNDCYYSLSKTSTGKQLTTCPRVGLLCKFRDDAEFQSKFSTMSPSMKSVLCNIANIQGTIMFFGRANMNYNHAVAINLIRTLRGLISWLPGHGEESQCLLQKGLNLNSTSNAPRLSFSRPSWAMPPARISMATESTDENDDEGDEEEEDEDEIANMMLVTEM